MPTGIRSRFLLSFVLAFSAAACLPVQAQINGVPPSVTSLGFGGRFINGVRPSVTSLGPNGYGSLPFLDGCCANFFLPGNPNASSGHHHRRKDKDLFPVGVIEPVYVPYAVPDAEQAENDSPDPDSLDLDSPDLGYAHGAGPLNADSLGKRAGNRHSMANGDALGQAEKPVGAQPSTVLVFKDGHRSEVLNYAVVGDTLFDFAADRTHKILLGDLDLPATQEANDDRRVDFQIPADAIR